MHIADASLAKAPSNDTAVFRHRYRNAFTVPDLDIVPCDAVVEFDLPVGYVSHAYPYRKAVAGAEGIIVILA